MADSSKTEQPTPHRRKKAREEGQIVRSREFGNVAALLGAGWVLSVQCRGLAEHWRGFYIGLLGSAAGGDLDLGGPILFWTGLEVLRWIAPALLVAALCSTGASLAQGGFNIAPGLLTLQFKRLNPGSRMGQIFSLAALGGLLRSMLPFALIAVLCGMTLREAWSSLARASTASVLGTVAVVTDALSSIIWKSALTLLAAAGLDYVLMRRQSEAKLRMSHDEIKREHKEQEGNPFIKIQIRKRQRAMRARKPAQAAASATMVVTNPTHFAVALKYEPSLSAPQVIAKGRNLLAQRIKAIAAENQIPTIENKPLARALYQNVEVGDPIPAELYQAVAEILVAVFRAQEEARQSEQRRMSMDPSGKRVVQPMDSL